MSGDSRQSDAELLRAVRAGGTMAYGALYERHVAAARALAAQLVHDEAEVEDVVAETFGAVLDQVRRGGGPEAAFRPYLLSAVRRTCHERTGAWPSEPGERGEPSASGEPGEPGGPSEPDELGELVERGEPVADAGPARLERAPIARAFLSLPERWRLVLWHTEVENARPAAVAPLLGMSAGGAAALASRAREGLRQAYLHMHLAGASRQECRPVAAKLGAYARGGLGRRESRLVDEHIADCTDCRAVYHELNDLGQGLRVVVGPLYTGPVLAGYLAALARAEGGRAVPVLGRIDRTPKPWLVAFAVSAPVAAAVVAGAYFLVSAEGPVRPFARPPAITPTPTIMPAPERQEPPSARPSPPRRPEPTPVPPPPAAPERRPAAGARLVASIDPLGALVRAQPGIVAVRLRNEGRRASGELTALIEMPPGVSLLASGRRGAGAAVIEPVGTVDGWSCRPGAGGARCTRRPLPGGAATALFLRVAVAPRAPEGPGPVVRVAAGRVRVSARAESGVRTAGAPARFATDGRVATRVIGGTLLSCPADARGCAAARRRAGARPDNDLWHMRAVDRDRDRTTESSSSARLALPRGGRLVWAGLYWSGGGSAGTAAAVKVRPPGRSGYVRVRAAEVNGADLPAGHGYQAFADVTRLAGAGAEGTWWVADPQLREGVSRHAGWSLVVIATDPRRPYSQAVVLDTTTPVHHPTDGGTALEMPLAGLTPAAAPARVDLVVWEGDAGLAGDRVSVGRGTPLRPAGGGRDPANPFDGSVPGSADGTFGVDVDAFHSVLGRDPVLRVATRRDVLLCGVVVVNVHARS